MMVLSFCCPTVTTVVQLQAESEPRETQVLWLQKFSDLAVPIIDSLVSSAISGFCQIPNKLLNFSMCRILDKRQKVFCSMCCLLGCHGVVLVKLIVQACEALAAESKCKTTTTTTTTNKE